MTSGTKVLLAVIGLFVGVLIAYYGFFLSPEAPPTAGMSDPAMTSSETSGTDRAEARGARTGESRRTPNRPFANGALTMGEPTPPPVRPSARPVVPLAQPAVRDAVREPVTAALPPAPERPAGTRDQGIDRTVSSTRRVTPPVAGSRESGPAANRPAVTTPPRATIGRPVPPAFIEYRVREGDTLSAIAESWFGDGTLWDLIAKANPRVDPTRLRIGQALRLPPRDTTRTGAPVPAPPDVSEHVVRGGETLSSIAERYLGSPHEWRRVFEANRRLLGNDPDRLKVGMRLRIPG